MQSRRTYAHTVAYVLLALFIVDVACIALRYSGYFRISLPLGLIKNLLVLYIIIFESENSQKVSRRINYLLLPLAVFGFLFIIQHWPFGRELFFGSLFLMLLLLFIDTIKNGSSKTRLLILMFALVHYVTVFFSVHRLPAGYFAPIIELLFTGIVATVLLFWLFKHKSKLSDNSGS